MPLFKKKAPEVTELDKAVDAIIAYEDKEAEAKKELEAAESKLRSAYSDDLDSTPSADGVTAAAARHRALQELRKDAESKGIALIAKAQVASRERLAEVELELAETKQSIDERRIKIFAEFAQQYQLRVVWPSKQNAGAIHLPALAVDGPALLEIADAVKAVVHRDKDADQLDKLHQERTLLTGLTRGTPPAGLEMLVLQRRKQ